MPTIVFWWCPQCQTTASSYVCDLCGGGCRREEEETEDYTDVLCRGYERGRA